MIGCDHTVLKVDIKAIHEQFIHGNIEIRETADHISLTMVYGLNTIVDKKAL